MAAIKMRMASSFTDTPLPNEFIDRYLPHAKPVYVMVYILGLRHCLEGGDGISIQELAQKLELFASEVIQAWKYWAEKKLVEIQDDSVENFAMEFKPMPSAEEKEREKAPDLKIKLAAQPSYTAKEIDIYMERSAEIRQLFLTAEAIFAKPLAYTELNMLLSFFEWYALPIDVIEVMLNYCVSNNKKGRNYLEAVARDWSENGIDSVEAAEEYINSFTVYNKILKAFGISGKTPNKKQIVFMKRWLEEYKNPMDVILDACETTFLQTGKAKFEYADKMLKDWAEKGVETVSDIEKLNEQFREQKTADTARETKTTKPAGRQPYKNRFINYEQREWDYDQIEALAQRKLFES
jgi:DnaD/phage-associated family protein